MTQDVFLDLLPEMTAKKASVFFQRCASKQFKFKLSDAFRKAALELTLKAIADPQFSLDNRIWLVNFITVSKCRDIPILLQALGTAMRSDRENYDARLREQAVELINEFVSLDKCSQEQVKEAGLEDHISTVSSVF